jgi:hypothetical protein
MPTYVLIGISKCYDKHFIMIYETFVGTPCPYMTIGLPHDYTLNLCG